MGFNTPNKVLPLEGRSPEKKVTSSSLEQHSPTHAMYGRCVRLGPVIPTTYSSA